MSQNNNEGPVAALLIIAVLVVIGISMVLGYEGRSSVESKKRITPDLHIEYNNGVADTTFIYRVK
jgi:hypothetical protein